MQTLTVKTGRRTQLLDVTAQVEKAVSGAKISKGVCYLYVPHTTAGIAINECADPDVARDIEDALDRMVQKTGSYRHGDGYSDYHIKSVVVDGSQVVLVASVLLELGHWQSMF